MYPGPRHMLRRLGVEIDQPVRSEIVDGLRLTGRIPVTADLCDDGGRVRAGVVATLVDVIGGGLSVRTAAPDWAVTADLSLRLLPHRFAPDEPSPVVEATGSIVRAGRRAIVMEVDAVTGGPGAAVPVAHATMSFTVMTRNESNQVTISELDEPAATRFAWPDDEAPVPYFELVGLTVEGDRASVSLGENVQNSFGALQGGLIGSLLDAASVAAGGGRTVALDAYYLGLGRVGPFEARGIVLGGSTVRVELRDTGADDRLMTVALATVEPTGAVAA
jgi:acyl-coenzyme A thioesterase PaaI-like protein